MSANSDNYGSDAIKFNESRNCLEVTLTVCYNLGCLSFSFPKMGSVYKFLVPTCKIFQF